MAPHAQRSAQLPGGARSYERLPDVEQPPPAAAVQGDGGGGGGLCGGARQPTDNRLTRLLRWDFGAFVSCLLLFGALAAALAWAEAAEDDVEAAAEAAAAAEGGHGSDAFDTHDSAGGTLGRAVALLGSVAWWSGWRLQVSFFLARLLFALTALPFLLFEVPLLRTLLSHTYPTGYDERGACRPQDTDGLKAYSEWLGGQLGRPAVRDALGGKAHGELGALVAAATALLLSLIHISEPTRPY